MNRKLRYSAIIGDSFYKIGLMQEHRDLVDVHFTAAAHHYLLLPKVESDVDRQYHIARHRAHMRAMMTIVYRYGDFSKAIDESLRGLELRERWNPITNFTLPDPKMFNSMHADPTCKMGEPHPSDHFLAAIPAKPFIGFSKLNVRFDRRAS